MFVVATGGSLDPYYMSHISEFIANMTLSLPVDDGQVRVGLMTYGLQVALDIGLGEFTSASDIIAALDNITYHGNRSVHC